MNLLVLGGGQQGRVIATDLATALPHARVTVADLRRPELAALGNLAWVEADGADATVLARLMSANDLVVGALPSRLGYSAMRAAIEARRSMVDVSFSAENPLTLDSDARRAGVALVPDCGLAPGLSHLLLGHAAATHGTPDEAVIYVGGVAQDATRPFGYVVTWSVDDLLEEFVRPARIQRDGNPAEVPVFSGYERVSFAGVGEMEAFLSDGLRTLLDTYPEIRDMAEKTLRWPGHIDAIRPLLARGTFVATMRAQCSVDPPEDLVVLAVRARWGSITRETLLVDRYDPATRHTAMARTTALTTSVCAQMLAAGLARTPGVNPLERVARDPRAFEFVRDGLARRGVRFHAAS